LVVSLRIGLLSPLAAAAEIDAPDRIAGRASLTLACFYGPQLAATSRLPFGPQQEAAEVESKVVLIVDDSEDNRFLYQTILTYAGYGVLEVRKGWSWRGSTTRTWC
jgi:hypothetical protein